MDSIKEMLALVITKVKALVSQATAEFDASALAQEAVSAVKSAAAAVVDVIEKPRAADAVVGLEPEDSTLKRHYHSTLQAARLAITHPYPTDSALRRHYDSMQRMALVASVAPTAVSVAPAVDAPVVVADAVEVTVALPEDSMLRRHYLTHLQSQA